MDKEQALARLAALESEAAALRSIIEAPDRAPSLLTKPVPGSGEEYWDLRVGVRSGCFYADPTVALSTDERYEHGNFFQTEALAEAYAEALDTLLLLRHQPGTVAPEGEKQQWLIRVDGGGIYIEGYRHSFTKISEISPCFQTREDVQAAVKTIGADRILRMFRTLHHA